MYGPPPATVLGSVRSCGKPTAAKAGAAATPCFAKAAKAAAQASPVKRREVATKRMKREIDRAESIDSSSDEHNIELFDTPGGGGLGFAPQSLDVDLEGHETFGSETEAAPRQLSFDSCYDRDCQIWHLG